MAEKVIKTKPAKTDDPAGPDDLAVLFPDQAVTIQGERLTVREYRYLEGLQVLAQARPLLNGLRDLIVAHGETLAPEQLDLLIAEHAELWVALVARACDREAAWVAKLPNREAACLQLAFWRANGFFFTNQLLVNAGVAAALAMSFRSASSSSNSSPSASDATSTISPAVSRGANSAAIGN